MRTPIKSLSVIWKIFLKPRGTYWWCVVFVSCKVFWPFRLGVHYCRTIFLCFFSGRVELYIEKNVLSSYAYANLTPTWLIEYIWYVCTMHCVGLGFRLHSASSTQRSRVVSWQHPDLSAYSRLAVFRMEISKTGLVFLNATRIKVFSFI